MADRYFTLEEARRVLPEVRQLMGRSVTALAVLRELAPLVRPVSGTLVTDAGSPAGSEYASRLLELHTSIARLQELGCEIKGLEEGLVDFRCLRDGREVYLCWKYGEEDIGFWHEIDAGFAGRQPIADRNPEGGE
jgi:hypothetical protein